MAKAKSVNPSIDEIIEHIKGLNIYVVGPHEEARDGIVVALEKLRDELGQPKDDLTQAIANNDKPAKTTKALA